MKSCFPGRFELALFALISIGLALIVSTLLRTDAGLSLLSFPLFVGAALTGLFKSGRLRADED
jgi:hypothetical protein